MKKQIFGILLAALVISSMPAFAAERNDVRNNDASRQELCYGGCYGDGSNGGYCGRGYRGNQQ